MSDDKNIIFKKILIAIYFFLLLLVLAGKYELIFGGNYPLRKIIWTFLSIASFALVMYYGHKTFKKIETKNTSRLEAVVLIIGVFIGMGIWARLAPDISKNDEKQFLKKDFRNFEKIFLIKQDIFKQHKDIYNVLYNTTVRQSNYWQMKNLAGDWLEYDLNVYDINHRLSNLTEENEIKTIDLSMSEIKYYFNGFSKFILVRKDSISQPDRHEDYIGCNYYIKEDDE